MSRSVLLALVGVVVLVAAFLLSLWTLHREEQPAPATVSAPVAPPLPPAGQAAAAPVRPAFDIVRINPQGETVIAGRAMPKAEVQILDGGKEIGRVIADNRGEWVFVPDAPLPAGNRELTLKAQNPDGTSSESAAPVLLVVPEHDQGKAVSLAIKVNPDGSLEVLQGPPAAAGAGDLTITAVNHDSQGRLTLSGTAPPQARIQLYLDNKPLGLATADDQGHWRLQTGKQTMAVGNHSLRADQLGADGKVTGRAEISFAPAAAGTATEAGRVTVESGNSLWRIARGIYGSGFDYIAIYQANKDQIRDPDRIYPGQVFTLPAAH